MDDGSPDNSGEILDHYALIDSRVKVIHKINGGVSSARNAALDEIENDGSFSYLAIIDSDDYVTVDFLSTVIDAMESKKADYAVFGSEAFDKKGPIAHDEYKYPTELLLDSNDIARQFFQNADHVKGKHDPTCRRYLGNKVFNLSKISGERFDTHFRCGEDQEFLIRNLPNLKIGIIVPSILHLYRMRRSSLSHDRANSATAYDLELYEKYFYEKQYATKNARLGLEQMLLDCWWQETRRVFQQRLPQKDRKRVRDAFARLKAAKFESELPAKMRRRFVLYSVGDWFISLYFQLRKNKNDDGNKYSYFE